MNTKFILSLLSNSEKNELKLALEQDKKDREQLYVNKHREFIVWLDENKDKMSGRLRRILSAFAGYKCGMAELTRENMMIVRGMGKKTYEELEKLLQERVN